MKATVTTTTLSILATMTLVVACGSKKDKPADPAAAPVAPAAIEKMGAGDYQAVSRMCQDGSFSKDNEAATKMKLTLTDKGTYTLTAEKNEVESGNYEFKVNETKENLEKGSLSFKPTAKDEKEKGKEVVKSTEFVFQNGTLIVITPEDKTVCDSGPVQTKYEKVRGTAPAPEDTAKNPETSKNAAPSVGDVPAAPATTGTDAPAPETLPAAPAPEKSRK